MNFVYPDYVERVAKRLGADGFEVRRNLPFGKYQKDLFGYKLNTSDLRKLLGTQKEVMCSVSLADSPDKDYVVDYSKSIYEHAQYSPRKCGPGFNKS